MLIQLLIDCLLQVARQEAEATVQAATTKASGHVAKKDVNQAMLDLGNALSSLKESNRSRHSGSQATEKSFPRG